MSFLQPWMLIALPLAAIPIIIHLINQRRYQTTQWAAMQFLLAANRMNRGFARVRQWLILAFRALVIAALVFAVGRPLVSGALGTGMVGSMLGQGASTAIVLIDRSPSMQTRFENTPQTNLESGLAQLSETLSTMGIERVVLIESNTALPRELDSPGELLDVPSAGPSDATADLPAMLTAALDHINANQLGQSDVWILSDLHEPDWRDQDGRWRSLREAYAEFGRRIRFRLMAMPVDTDPNRHIRVTETKVDADDDTPGVLVSLEIVQGDGETGSSTDSENIPVTFDVLGTRSTVEVEMQNGVGELVGHRLPLPAGQFRGHGMVSIPADINPSDNTFYFTFDKTPPRRAVIVTEDEAVGRVLRLASEIPADDRSVNAADILTPRESGSIRWDELGLVLWHAPLPTAKGTDGKPNSDLVAMESFIQRGGQIVFFPPTDGLPSSDAATRSFRSIRWGPWKESEEAVAVKTWRGDSDLLSASLAGASLPVGKLRVNRYATIDGDATPLAELDGGAPLLVRVPTERGGVYFCTTTPDAEDSSLATDGVVLYVMLQRALAEGAKSLGNTRQINAGESDPKAALKWRRLAGSEDALSTDNAFIAGVYQRPDDGHWLAVNRGENEDATAVIDEGKVESLFAGLVFDRVDPQAGQGGSLVEEAWRAFLVIMLIAMIGEACLCLPKPRVESSAESSGFGARSGNTSSGGTITGGAAA